MIQMYKCFMGYDSTVRRYVERDPIGLEDRLNPHLHANANPSGFTDPTAC